MARRRLDIGIEEMTSVQANSADPSGPFDTMLVAFPSAWLIEMTLCSMRTGEPFAST